MKQRFILLLLTLYIINIPAQQELVKTLEGHTARVSSIAFSSNGKFLVSGSYDKTVKIWDVASWSCQKTLQGHTKDIYSVSFSPDNKFVASGSADNFIIWDAESGSIITAVEANKRVYAITFSPDGKLLAFCGTDDKIKIYDVSTWQLIKTFKNTSSAYPYSISFSPNSKLLVCGYAEKYLIWDIETEKVISTVKVESGWVLSVAYSHDGKMIGSGGEDKTMRVTQVEGLGVNKFTKHTDWVNSVDFSSDDKYLASGSTDGTIRNWNIILPNFCMHTYKGNAGRVNSVKYSTDNKFIVSAHEDKIIKVWDATLRDEASAVDISSEAAAVKISADVIYQNEKKIGIIKIPYNANFTDNMIREIYNSTGSWVANIKIVNGLDGYNTERITISSTSNVLLHAINGKQFTTPNDLNMTEAITWLTKNNYIK